MRLQEAVGHRLSHGEFLEMILQDELLVRGERLIARRTKFAGFRELKAARWTVRLQLQHRPSNVSRRFRPGHRPVHSEAHATYCWSARREQAKSHIAQALGHQAIKNGFTVLYRSIFDVVRDFLHQESNQPAGPAHGSLPPT